MLKVGLIGAGFIAGIHAEAYRKLNTARLFAITNINENKGMTMAERFGCRYCRNAEELIASSEIDIVDICVPTYLHETYVVQAARAGKHALVEKPLTLSLESAERILTEVSRAGVKFMVAHVLRFWPEYALIKEFSKTGVFGDVHMVHAVRLAQAPDWSPWFQDPEKSGGALFDLHLHDIDYLYYLLGPVKSVYAVGRKSNRGAWYHVMTTVEFACGAKAFVEANNNMVQGYPFTMSLRVTGSKNTAEFLFTVGFNLEERDSATNRLVLYHPDKSPQVVKPNGGDAYLEEIAYFIDCVAENKEPKLITPQENLEVLRIAVAIKESLESGKVVPLL